MQIDFHHATTYVVAREAGFSHDDADIIAYASQYVDDATSSGAIFFDNRAVYYRISSAIHMGDRCLGGGMPQRTTCQHDADRLKLK